MAIDSGDSDSASGAVFPPQYAAFHVLESMLCSQHSKVVGFNADVENFLAWEEKEKEGKQQEKSEQVTLTLTLTLALTLTLTPVQVGLIGLVPGQTVCYKGNPKLHTIYSKGRGEDVYTFVGSNMPQYLAPGAKGDSWSTVDSPPLSEKKKRISIMQCSELRNNLQGFGHRKETVGKVKKVQLARMLQFEVCKRKKEHVY